MERVRGKIDGSVRSRVLRKDVGDEVAKSFGVLLGVDCGDFSAGLQQREGGWREKGKPLFTWAVPDGVHVHVGVELPGPQRFAAGHVPSDALWRGAIGPHRGPRQAVLCVWIFLVGHLLALLFITFSSTHIVDPEQQAVVHDLQPHQELKRDIC
ncbi:hypothetical protein F7725_001095 [Dissostichus mawsoni]|uniref:Uncharacterized protein n=1 Tax=Dissostichus mawsoni TaxID=36200 RepID=A0A7J5ZGR6_DISMA|nr:hypothetical protein F7725_001095 [Dissostichus mawsoni]